MKKSFTLIELVLVIAIVTILAVAMVPIIRSSIEDANIAKMLQLADILKDACQRHYSDTGRYAWEFSGSPIAVNHQLAYDIGTPNWNGPYISKPISADDAVYGGWVSLFWAVGRFDLDSNGINEITSSCNWMRFSAIPESLALKVNNKLDKSIPGDWRSAGKVEYLTLHSYLDIYLIGGT